MKQILHVDIKNYDITISDDNFYSFIKDIMDYTNNQKRLFVVSSKVYKLYSKALFLNNSEIFILKDGEKEKNYKNYLKIIELASQRGFTRKDVFIAIGGGVVGDITGFAASTYMRGIDYIQVPTTLLSAVDSSVGGKTAINMDYAKNILGSFYQPKAVFININFLKTLDKRQFRSGLGEIIKYAFIENSCTSDFHVFLFEYLALCCDKVYEFDSISLVRIIEYCLKLKIAVVNADEKEVSLRKILNLGHTLAHALETITNYKKFTHGEAVVYGLYFALKLAYEKELIKYSYYRMAVDLLEKYGFASLNLNKYNKQKLLAIMQNDKKAQHDKIIFILPNGKKTVQEIEFTQTELAEFI
ncbi:MAG: 3-dehydroquinate synthase [bacterium]|nr:3-dehydroquinate synthase [bacterium]